MLKRLIPTLPIDIQNDNTRLSVQQHLTLQQRYYALSQLSQANDSLDNKGIALLTSFTLIFALIGALEFPVVIKNPTLLVILGIVTAFLMFFRMVYLLFRAWSPTDHQIPGTSDWDKLHEEYIRVGSNESIFTQVLDDCVKAYDDLKETNKHKAKYIKAAIFLFVAQISGLLILALLSPLSS